MIESPTTQTTGRDQVVHRVFAAVLCGMLGWSVAASAQTRAQEEQFHRAATAAICAANSVTKS